MTPPTQANLPAEHAALEAQLRVHLLAVIGGEFVPALAQLQTWLHALQAHMEWEEEELLPHLPTSARWASRVYLLEHQRIRALADDYLRVVQKVVHTPPPPAGVRTTALALIDAAHALRHLLEHHHQREEKALAHELPAEVLRKALDTVKKRGEPGQEHRL